MTTAQKPTSRAAKNQTMQTQVVNSKSWVITNSTNFDIVVINAYAQNEDDTAVLYAQTLQTLTTSENKKWIAKGGSATVTLDSGQAVDNLIIARASTLSPVKVIDAPADDATMPVQVSVSSSDVTAAGEAEKFQQYIVAFPSSDLATGYADALNDDDPTAADNFISGQEGYENASLNLVVAFQSYYDRFPLVYAAYKSEHSYYLYTSDGTNVTYVGSVLLENSNTAPLDTESVQGKFKATFTNSTEDRETRLTWANGQFSDEADNPFICLRGLFMQRSMLTKSDKDSGLMATLGGRVDDKDIIAYDKRVSKDKNGFYAELDALRHPQSAADYAILVGAVLVALAVLTGLGAVCQKIADVIRRSNKTVPKTPEELRAEKLEMIQKNRAEVVKIVKKMNPNANLPEDVKVSLARYKGRVTEWLIEQQRHGLNDIIEEQQTYYAQILDVDNIPAEMQRVYDNMEYVSDVLATHSPEALQPKLKELMDTVKENTKILNETMKKSKNNWDAETKKTISEARQQIELVTKQMDVNEADRERIEDDEVPDVDIVEVEID